MTPEQLELLLELVDREGELLGYKMDGLEPSWWLRDRISELRELLRKSSQEMMKLRQDVEDIKSGRMQVRG